MDNQATLKAIISDALKIIRNPVEFYQSMPKSGGYTQPLIFVLIMSVISGLEAMLFGLDGVGAIFGLGIIILIPIFAIIGSFTGAAIIFVIWLLMGSSEDYETAFRCNAYMSAIYPITVLLEPIPYIGTIISLIWIMYLVTIASIKVQQLKRQTTYIVFGTLAAAILVLSISDEITSRSMIADAEILQKQYAPPN